MSTKNTGKYKVTASSGLNVRSGPGSSYSKVTILFFNEEVEVTAISGDWGKISQGWINMTYTKYVGPLSNSSNNSDTTSNKSEEELATEWVKQNGISDGTNGNQTATRQQVWVMLYRFYNKLIKK